MENKRDNLRPLYNVVTNAKDYAAHHTRKVHKDNNKTYIYLLLTDSLPDIHLIPPKTSKAFPDILALLNNTEDGQQNTESHTPDSSIPYMAPQHC